MGNDLVESNYEQVVLDLLARVKRLEGASVVAQELSEISSDMGLIEGGELRIHSDWADPKEPGDGFSGVRILGAFEYPAGSGNYYAIVGANNDALTFGLSSVNGSAIFCSGNATINQDGISGTDLLKWMIKQTATNSTYTRTGKLGMALADGGGTIPNWELSYESPITGGELLLNGGFESDFTNWTKTTETGANWVVNSNAYYVRSGDKSLYAGLTALSSATKTLVLTSDRVAVTELVNYLFDSYIKMSSTAYGTGTYTHTVKIEVKWYDHASAGSLLQTDIIANLTSFVASDYIQYPFAGKAPSGALSCAIVITATIITGDVSAANLYVYFDDLSVSAITVNQKFQLTDDGLATTNGMFPQSVMLFPSMVESSTAAVTLYVSASQMWNLYGAIAAASAANGDVYVYSFMAEKGTYSMLYYYLKSSAGGKADIYIDDVKVVSLLDHYAASATYDQKSTTTAIAVTYNGRHELKLVVNGKHASSSDYSLYHSAISLWRTGA